MSMDAEASVIGGMMISETAIDAAVDAGLKASDFLESNGHVFDAIVALYTRGIPADAVTVADELAKTGLLEKIGGPEKVTELVGVGFSAPNTKHYAKIILDASMKRRILRVAHDMAEAAQSGHSAEEILQHADSRLLELQGRKADSVYTGKQLAERYRYRQEHPEEFESTIPPPFHFLKDQIVNGQLHVLAGYQGTGKTALLWQYAEAALNAGKKVGIWTLEMTPDQLTERLVTSHGAEKAMDLLDTWDVEIINDSVVSPETIRRRQRKARYDLILIDHLHRLPIRNPAHVRIEIAESVKKLTNVALEFNVPIILLCQLSRGPQHDPFPRPTTAQLKETSQIETDAAVIWFIWRKFDGFSFEQEAELITAKNRFGSPGWRKLNFRPSQVRFTESAF